MKIYKVKVTVNDGQQKRIFYTYMSATSEDEAKQITLNYWNGQCDVFVETTEVSEVIVHIDLTPEEAVKLYSICNANILSEENFLNATINGDPSARERIRKSMKFTNDLKVKIRNACKNREVV